MHIDAQIHSHIRTPFKSLFKWGKWFYSAVTIALKRQSRLWWMPTWCLRISACCLLNSFSLKARKRRWGKNQYASIVPISWKSLRTDGISAFSFNFIASYFLSWKKSLTSWDMCNNRIHVIKKCSYANCNFSFKRTFIRFSASNILALAASSFFFRLAYE